MELLNVLLDVLDAVAGAFGLATFWVTWVRPRRGPKRIPSGNRNEAADVDRFLHEASERRGRDGARA
jgi:hypothetical protein